MLLYKSQGSLLQKYSNIKKDDFILITMDDVQGDLLWKLGSKHVCIDGTHKNNAYDFHQVTLLILGYLNEGVIFHESLCHK